MGTVQSESGRPGRSELSVSTALLVAIACGLAAGYLDVTIIILKRFFLNPEGYYRIARDFPWSVPAVHAAMLAIPGLAIGIFWRLTRGVIPAGLGVWVLATLGLWGALLRLPLHWAASLLLAGGLARLAAGRLTDVRLVRRGLVAMLVLLAVAAAVSTGRERLAESRAVGRLPAPPSGARARNVVLIVWDTVRAYNLGLYGYPRPTTPNLDRWLLGGVMYSLALAPAPWTFPSHTSLLTGQWPLRLDSQWKMKLETADPTLAEYLASRGYQTAGFVGNTNCCTYESGLGRGFAHYEDYSLAPLALLGRTIPGGWLVQQVLRRGGWYHAEKWARLQARDASGINDAFLGWLDRRRPDRPFFAFLNYFDAHEPYLPPPGFAGRFGTRLVAPRDYEFLLDYTAIQKISVPNRDIMMARDAYDDCIAYLDDQLGRLMAELDRRGLMGETEVIITSDHGEAFGDHGVLGHSYSLYLDEIGVPLVMLSPEAPAGWNVTHVVSLRDIPATVVDRLGLAEDSPFPGCSLAACWTRRPGRDSGDLASPAFAEQVSRATPRPEPGPGGMLPGFQMSVIVSGDHYIRDGAGKEQLYSLTQDPFEWHDILGSSEPKPDLTPYRRELLKVLVENPGTKEVERAYLDAFRRSLQSLVGDPVGKAPVIDSSRSRP